MPPLIILGNYCRCCHEAPATQIDPEVGHVCSDCQGLLVWAEGLLANAGIRPPNDSDILPPNS